MKIIKAILYLVSLAIIIYFLIAYHSSFKIVNKLEYYEFIFLFILGFIALSIQAFQFKKIILIKIRRFKILDSFEIIAVATMYNYILPARGGLFIRGLYLKGLYDFNWSSFISVMGSLYFYSFGLLSFLIFIFSFLLSDTIKANLLYISVSVFILILLFYYILKKIEANFSFKNKILQLVISIAASFKVINKNPKKVIVFLFLEFFILILMALKLYFTFKFLGYNVAFIRIIYVQSLLAFSLVFSITPGNFGIREGIIALSSNILGVEQTEAITISLIDRAVQMMVIFSLGIISKIILSRKLNKKTST